MLQTPAMSVQQGFRICATVDEYIEALHRLVDLAASRESKLVVFPELCGLMLLPALMSGVRPNLLIQARKARQKGATIVDKARGAMAGSLAGALRADMRGETLRWLEHPENLARLEETYRQVFSSLAADHRMTLVAGTCYRPGDTLGSFHNTAYVFGSDGSLLGRQDQMHLLGGGQGDLCAGESLAPIETPAGVLGILVGPDALFPEMGRALAYEGVDILINTTATANHLQSAKIRQAFQARIQENEVYGIQSCMVGSNPWRAGKDDGEFFGRSLIAFPFDLAPRNAGVITEMGKSLEGVLAATFDLPALHRWWDRGPGSLRRAMRPGAYYAPLADYYRAGQTVQGAYEARQVIEEEPSVRPLPPAPEPVVVEPQYMEAETTWRTALVDEETPTHETEEVTAPAAEGSPSHWEEGEAMRPAAGEEDASTAEVQPAEAEPEKAGDALAGDEDDADGGRPDHESRLKLWD